MVASNAKSVVVVALLLSTQVGISLLSLWKFLVVYRRAALVSLLLSHLLES